MCGSTLNSVSLISKLDNINMDTTFIADSDIVMSPINEKEEIVDSVTRASESDVTYFPDTTSEKFSVIF